MKDVKERKRQDTPRDLARPTPAPETNALAYLKDEASQREQSYQKAATRLHIKRIENRLDAVLEIGQTLASTHDPEQILTLLMEKITELMEADRSTLFLVDHKQGEIWSKVLQGDSHIQIRLALGQGIAGWVAQSGETVNLPDAHRDPRFDQTFDLQSGYRTRTMLTMPLLNQRGDIVGVIQVLNKRGEHPFVESDEELLHSIAAQAAIFLENARLYQELWQKHVELMQTSRQLQQRTQELDIVYDIEQQMSSAFDPDEILAGILNRVVQLLNCEASLIALQDPKTELITYHTTGPRAESFFPTKSSGNLATDGFLGWTLKHGEPLLSNEPALDPRFQTSSPLTHTTQPTPALRSVLCMPLQREDQLLGALSLLNKRTPRGFTPDDLRILRQIAAQISRAVEIGARRKQQMRDNRLATIGQLMSGVLHDLKGPMTIISGYAQMLTQQEDSAKREQYSQSILTQIERLNHMTREVLSFARGESTLLVRQINMNQFIAELHTLLAPEFEGSGVSLTINNHYKGHAHFDEIKLQRLMYNLARNARQAMANGGEFEINVEADEKQLYLRFKDTGPGIPLEIQPQVFDSFVTGRPKQGSGLGLAIVQKIVQEHQGEIRFTSIPGQGTTFHVTLPLNGPQSEGPKTTETPLQLDAA